MFIKDKQILVSPNIEDNVISCFDGTSFIVSNFGDKSNPAGGNGVVFSAAPLDNFQDESFDLQDEFVVKFSKFDAEHARARRFDWEIEALGIAKQNDCSNVVVMENMGEHEINGKKYPFIVMQRCDQTLDKYLAEVPIPVSQKILICKQIAVGLKNLHLCGIYHRDIKPANILFKGNEPFVCDLGLSAKRYDDYLLDEIRERIGPCGWFSPEAMNKVTTEGRELDHSFDFKIDESSDIFQLGKLFWYILQGNLPIGIVSQDDFMIGDKAFYDLITSMLAHSKKRRCVADFVLNTLDEIGARYSI